jgi:hypothetical protein
MPLVESRGHTFCYANSMTPAEPQLNIGDPIRLIRPIAGVAAGTRGIFLRRFTFDSLYDVWFDGSAAPRLVHKRDVAAAPPEASTA